MGNQGSDTKLTIEQVKEKYEMHLLTSIEGVTGIGIGSESGKPVIKIYVEKKSIASQGNFPRQLEGYPVSIEVTGGLHAL